MRTLERIEQSIARRLKDFRELGQDFKDIRDGNFREACDVMGMGSNRNNAYREVMQLVLGYPTLEEYWEGKWGMKINYVNKLIMASEMVSDLKLDGTVVPPNTEAQMRAMKSAPAEERGGIWIEAVKKANESGREQPTSKEVFEAYEALIKKKVNQDPIQEIMSEFDLYLDEFERAFKDAWLKLTTKYSKQQMSYETMQKEANEIMEIFGRGFATKEAQTKAIKQWLKKRKQKSSGQTKA
jgi:hypothetical protein